MPRRKPLTAESKWVAGEIRAWIARGNHSRPAVADALHISVRTLGDRLTEKSAFSVDEIHRAANFFGTPLATLMPDAAA